MTKQKIKRVLERVADHQAFITATRLATAMGYKTPDYVKKKYLAGLERVNKKLYLIDDVVEAIMNNKELEYGEETNNE